MRCLLNNTFKNINILQKAVNVSTQRSILLIVLYLINDNVSYCHYGAYNCDYHYNDNGNDNNGNGDNEDNSTDNEKMIMTAVMILIIMLMIIMIMIVIAVVKKS